MKKIKKIKFKKKEERRKSGKKAKVTRFYELNDSLGIIKKIILEDLKHFYFTEVTERCFIISPSKYSSDKYRAKDLSNIYAIYIEKISFDSYLLLENDFNTIDFYKKITSISLKKEGEDVLDIDINLEEEDKNKYMFFISIENRFPIEEKKENTEIENMKNILNELDFIFSYFFKNEVIEKEYFF